MKLFFLLCLVDRLLFSDELHPAVLAHANLLCKCLSVIVKVIETLSTQTDGINDDINVLYCEATIHLEVLYSLTSLPYSVQDVVVYFYDNYSLYRL